MGLNSYQIKCWRCKQSQIESLPLGRLAISADHAALVLMRIVMVAPAFQLRKNDGVCRADDTHTHTQVLPLSIHAYDRVNDENDAFYYYYTMTTTIHVSM
jgi:hypothetical protein